MHKNMMRCILLNIHAIKCYFFLASEIAMKKQSRRIAFSLTQDCNNLKIMQNLHMLQKLAKQV